MNLSVSIRVKAAVLLAVFSLNTVVGLACTIGVDMGFNTKHHADEQAMVPVVHMHKDGKKHVHHEKKHTHVQPVSQKKAYTNNPEKFQEDTGNCCTGEVRKFEQLDKSVPASANTIIPAFFIAFIGTYCDRKFILIAEGMKDMKAFVRSYHPPILDIRIAIQSFQI